MSLHVGGQDELSLLRSDLARLREELEASKRRVVELEQRSDRTQSTDYTLPRPTGLDTGMDIAPIQEGDVTLRRLVQRIAMILQAEKIAIMFYDPERGELLGIPPSFGIDEERLKLFRVRATHGVSGQVFRDAEPVIFHDATSDPRTKKDMVTLLHVHNGITVPLVIEKRDEENRVIERNTIGVLHAFNKRHGEDFNEEDVRLLERMAKNVGSIIANLQLYKQVVEEREELLQTFESLTSGLVLVSPEGKISQINAVARAILNLNSTCLGKPFADVIPDKAVSAFLEKGLRGEEFYSMEHTQVLHGIERIFALQGAQVRNEEGKSLGFVALINDVTDQKNLDRMKSSFVAMASHELRTPLTAIKGFVSTLLMDDTFSQDERLEFYQIIDQECDRLTRLINDLLNTARIEANESLKPNFQRVNFRNLVDKVIVIQKQATMKHRIYAKVRDDIPMIIGDEDKLDQILTNLMNNAIKYSPGGGDVILHVRVEDGHLVFGVEDEGIGIPQEHMAKVFEKFHRVNNEDNRIIYGTGLGLFLVKHLVEQVHLGKIWVDSEVGKGSTFWVRIPLALDIEKAKELNQ